jgi:hypothetical protein
MSTPDFVGRAEALASDNGHEQLVQKAQEAQKGSREGVGEGLNAHNALSAHLWKPPPAWPTLDDKALYGLVGEVVETLAPHTEADPAGLLFDFAVAFGNVLGSGPHAIADAALHPARLNAVLVGETAKARKGTTRANVGAVLDRADTAWASERIRSGVGSGEGVIAAVDEGDRRLLIVEPEFARLLQVAERSGSIVSPIIRDAWDTGRLSTITKANPLRVNGAHVSVLGHITVEELRRRLTETEMANGFANRFLFVCVRRTKLLPSGGSLPPREQAELTTLIRERLDAARTLGLIRRSAAAEERWAELYVQMADDDPGGLVGHITARAEAQTLRLSVFYALADGCPLVEVEHLDAAYAAWKYCRDSAAYVFGDTLGDEIADRLLAALREAGATGLDLTEQYNLFGRHVSRARIAAARELLEGMRLVRTTAEETGGRPRAVTVAVGGRE